MSAPIKLHADDEDGLKIISACLQDAIVLIQDVCWVTEDQRFILVANRFKWECAGRQGEDTPYQRTHCAVSVHGVTSVRRRNIDLHDRGLILNLLALLAEDHGLTLLFADDRAIHLDTASRHCFVQDLGEPWPASHPPRHPLEGGEGGQG